ncbi:C-type lectin domain family 2 member B-like isoform X2 [Anolis sagrei]|uniref:C-type lectin domain family 2 member B-like isoform X2 n=1 Tax=Anolis sagrei TaxID=38937 RepID=UPI00351FD789
MQPFLTMGDEYQNEDYHRGKKLEELSHTSEVCSELRKSGSLPVSAEDTQENYEYIPDPDMLMRKLPKSGLKTEQGFPSCPHEWIMFQEKCYYYDQNMADWTNAKRTCHDLGADFVGIDNEEEKDFLVYNIPTKGVYWIGYYEGTSTRVDGSVSPDTNDPANPDQENCTVIKEPKYETFKESCTSNHLFICEKPIKLACVWHLLHNSFN